MFVINLLSRVEHSWSEIQMLIDPFFAEAKFSINKSAPLLFSNSDVDTDSVWWAWCCPGQSGLAGGGWKPHRRGWSCDPWDLPGTLSQSCYQSTTFDINHLNHQHRREGGGILPLTRSEQRLPSNNTGKVKSSIWQERFLRREPSLAWPDWEWLTYLLLLLPGLAKVQLTRTKGDQPVGVQERLYHCSDLRWGWGRLISADTGGTETHSHVTLTNIYHTNNHHILVGFEIFPSINDRWT